MTPAEQIPMDGYKNDRPDTAPPAEEGKKSLPAPGGSAISLPRSLRRHRMLAVLVALFIVAAGLPVAWKKGVSVYSTTAVVYVSPHFVANLQDGKEVEAKSDTQYHDYIQQNARTINRYDIVLDALQRLGPRKSTWLNPPNETMEHAVERLQGALAIVPVLDTYQITISLESTRKDGLADIVNGVVTGFIRRAKSEEFFASDERVKNLTVDRTRLEGEIAERQSRQLELAQKLGVSSFTENFVNPYDRLLVGAKEALAAAQRLNIDAMTQLAAISEKDRKGGAATLQAEAETEAGRDTSLTSLVATQNARRAQLMTAISGLSTEHPGRRAAERELAEMDKELRAVTDRLVKSWSKSILDRRNSEAFKSDRVVQQLTAEVNQQASQAMYYTKNYQEGVQLGVEIEAARKRIDSLQERIDFLSLEKNAPGFVRMFSSARPPSLPVKGGRRKLFGMVAVAALLIGLVAPVAVDFMDPRLQTPRSVETVLGFAPIAWLMRKEEAGPEFAHEQVLRLASRIIQDHQNNGARIFAFTSVKPRGGTSSIVMETAAAVVRLGVPALAVEANAYRADPRYRNNNSRGLTFVLRGNDELAAGVVPGGGDMADYVPLGDLEEQKNLPDIQRLIEILRASAEAYSVVFIDLPPILVSVDAEFIARGVDVAVLVVEADTVTKDDLKRAAACLERIKVAAVSAVMSKVSIDAGDGFAREARAQFVVGAISSSNGWFARRFWK
jgi:succinoglycan biosynthesis transport protein ExoP